MASLERRDGPGRSAGYGARGHTLETSLRVFGSRRRRLRRSTRYGVGVLLLLLGGTGIALGLVVQSMPEDRQAELVEPGSAYTAPERVPFVGDLVVYGTPPQGERPELDELGCQVTLGGGDLSSEDAKREDRIVVQGRGLVPLVSWPGKAGHSIACDGPGARSAAPLYVIPGGNGRDLIPLAGYCVGALCVPLGLLAVGGARVSET